MSKLNTVVDPTKNVCSTCKGTGIKLSSEESTYDCDTCTGTGLDKGIIKHLEDSYVKTFVVDKLSCAVTELTKDLNVWRNEFLIDIDGKNSIEESFVKERLKTFNDIFVKAYDAMVSKPE